MKASGESQEGQRAYGNGEMIELIDAVSKSDLTGFKYEEEGIKLHLSKKENTCYVTEKRRLIGMVDVKDLLTAGESRLIERDHG